MMLRALHANDVMPAAQMKKSKSFDLDFLAGDEGFEPSQTESESVVLPLHKSPVTQRMIL